MVPSGVHECRFCQQPFQAFLAYDIKIQMTEAQSEAPGGGGSDWNEIDPDRLRRAIFKAARNVLEQAIHHKLQHRPQHGAGASDR